MRKYILTLTSVLFLAGCASKQAKESREAILSLPWKQFDQTAGSGWRAFNDRREYREGGELIEAYLRRHKELTVLQRTVCHYHAGLQFAYCGENTIAVRHFDQ